MVKQNTYAGMTRLILQGVFFVEVLMRLYVGAYLFCAPTDWLRLVYSVDVPPSVSLELHRQFGATTLVSGGMLFSALWSKNLSTLSLVLQTFVVADIFACITIYQMYVQEGHVFGNYNTFRLCVTIAMALCRMLWFVLYKYKLGSTLRTSKALQKSLSSMETVLSTNPFIRQSLDSAFAAYHSNDSDQERKRTPFKME